jgi:hypothetical protein
MQHDRRFKELLHRFLPRFLRLFLPEQAARLDFSTLIFLDKEPIINLPGQVVRISDIVAEVATLDGEPETIIVHLEVEGRGKKSLSERMVDYYSLLRILRRKRILPIAVVLTRSAKGIVWTAYQETLFGTEILRFQYAQIGLRGVTIQAA